MLPASKSLPGGPFQPERLLHATPEIRVGTFRCPVDAPGFETAGAIEGYTIYFPRSAVWIEHEGVAPFVADSGVVTLYNRGQPYVRHPLAPDGDRGEWFSVSRELAVAIAASVDPAADPDRPFGVAYASSDPELYHRQRRLVLAIASGSIDSPSVEREVVSLIRAVLRMGRRDQPRSAAGAIRDLVERTKAEIARDPIHPPGLRELAARVRVSPFHLCREFRRVTGRTPRRYALDLRLRAALERLETADCRLSGVAHSLGFSSHSHMSFVFRRRLGSTPSGVRAALKRAAAGRATAIG
jgi:AraC-like DNA-binding protein